mmetsp:Transcript_128250/g.235937  ORF Transcript_128250/g.235937 Transcript_128250/m.235937 type:complete len:91 (-) Transcript_128250:50-322(-)
MIDCPRESVWDSGSSPIGTAVPETLKLQETEEEIMGEPCPCEIANLCLLLRRPLQCCDDHGGWPRSACGAAWSFLHMEFFLQTIDSAGAT